VLKQACAVSRFVKSNDYVELIERSLARWTAASDGRAFAMIGHSRLVTNGTQSTDANNQPVASAGVVAIHNGIIVNDAELWRRHPELERRAEVDTEIVANLMRSHLDRTGNAAEGTRLAFGELSGSASIAAFLDDVDGLVLATNTGSLFFLVNEKRSFLAFASERYILQRLLKSKGFREVAGDCVIQQVRAGEGELVGLHGLEVSNFGLDGVAAPASCSKRTLGQKLPIVDHTANRRKNLRRYASGPTGFACGHACSAC
jgi:glutamine phosphoribosylpyrophosphate amidotransferase